MYNKSVIEEMPWYELIVDEPQPEQIPQESAAVETPKRKNWKQALAAKAAELERSHDEETGLGKTQPEQAEQTSDVGSEIKSESNG